jgi:hypothetical protein
LIPCRVGLVPCNKIQPPRRTGTTMRGMGDSRAQRAGAARHARGRWTSVLGQPRGACHIHRHAVLASCQGAAWCSHKSPDPHSSLWDGGTRSCAPAGRCPRAAILRCSRIVASSRTSCRCPLRHSCTALPSCKHGWNAIRTIISTVSATRHAVCRAVRHAREERRTTCPRQRVGAEAR